jgi:hypothetical protein
MNQIESGITSVECPLKTHLIEDVTFDDLDIVSPVVV